MVNLGFFASGLANPTWNENQRKLDRPLVDRASDREAPAHQRCMMETYTPGFASVVSSAFKLLANLLTMLVPKPDLYAPLPNGMAE